jgi:hypothetical protein
MRPDGHRLAGEDVTPLAVAGAVLLWLLRGALAPASTLAGFRRRVVEECPGGRGRAAVTAPVVPLAPAAASRSKWASARHLALTRTDTKHEEVEGVP